MACRDCGAELVQTLPASMSSPAEWECPVCDGPWASREEYDRAMAAREAARDEYDEDDRHDWRAGHQPERD